MHALWNRASCKVLAVLFQPLLARSTADQKERQPERAANCILSVCAKYGVVSHGVIKTYEVRISRTVFVPSAAHIARLRSQY